MKSERYFLPNKIDLSPATSRQLQYAHSLGITLPDGASVSDAKALIDNFLDDDEIAPAGLLAFAKCHAILCSPYAGYKYLYNLLFDNLEPLDKVAFFCFCVYHDLTDDTDYALHLHAYHDLIYDFAKQKVVNVYFMESMKEYYGEELIVFGKKILPTSDGASKTVYGGSQYTLAYKSATDFIKEKIILNL